MCRLYITRYLRCGHSEQLEQHCGRRKNGSCPDAITIYNDLDVYCPECQHRGDPRL
ncbi:hypothetical protein CONLIGDRAFT_684526 [Coniochaeta ligniaria NRRL 30616]|uniref:Uncharacterized protein n=1 Tax=Coniochaeta ligniaria NRRL 30616 TaxID=1408157 RepID=A0A1J7IY29_9PEZI|nr:hypothetical protein CONLIGDRAFT_684526 [Coniochaeta ligniaria NRRL 30616]